MQDLPNINVHGIIGVNLKSSGPATVRDVFNGHAQQLLFVQTGPVEGHVRVWQRF